MNSILTLKEWVNSELNINYEDSEIKYLNEKTSTLHTEVENINEVMVSGKYVITTFIAGSKKDNHYILSVNIKHYDKKSEYEHKENSHGQKINI